MKVEVYHPVDPAKLQKYAKLWADIDATSGIYDLFLYNVDRFAAETRIDLSPFYYFPIVKALREHG